MQWSVFFYLQLSHSPTLCVVSNVLHEMPTGNITEYQIWGRDLLLEFTQRLQSCYKSNTCTTGLDRHGFKQHHLQCFSSYSLKANEKIYICRGLMIFFFFNQIWIWKCCLYWSAARIFHGSLFDKLCHHCVSLWPIEDSYELQVVSLWLYLNCFALSTTHLRFI